MAAIGIISVTLNAKAISREPHIGSSRSGGGSTIFNPSGGKLNCVKCVASLLEAIFNEGLHMTADQYPTTMARVPTRAAAFNYIAKVTDGGVTINPKQTPHVPGAWAPPGDYVVMTDFTFGRPEHISFARSVGGEVNFYDPQSGSTLPPSGQYELFPVVYSE
jgi:hypothetical protein